MENSFIQKCTLLALNFHVSIMSSSFSFVFCLHFSGSIFFWTGIICVFDYHPLTISGLEYPWTRDTVPLNDAASGPGCAQIVGRKRKNQQETRVKSPASNPGVWQRPSSSCITPRRIRHLATGLSVRNRQVTWHERPGAAMSFGQNHSPLHHYLHPQ